MGKVLDWLMTYGWALVVIVLVISALSFMISPVYQCNNNPETEWDNVWGVCAEIVPEPIQEQWKQGHWECDLWCSYDSCIDRKEAHGKCDYPLNQDNLKCSYDEYKVKTFSCQKEIWVKR